MYYLLMPNGRGILKHDATRLKSSVLKLKFAEAPRESVVTLCNVKKTYCLHLKNGEVLVDVSDLRGDVEIVVSDKKSRWVCDPLFIGEGEDGGIFVASKTCYGEIISSVVGEVEALKKELTEVKERLDLIEPKYAYVTNGSDIV